MPWCTGVMKLISVSINLLVSFYPIFVVSFYTILEQDIYFVDIGFWVYDIGKFIRFLGI